MGNTTATVAVRTALEDQIDASQIATESTEIAAAKTIWNGAVGHQPALVVRCRSTSEVQHAVQTSQTFSLPLSVRGGGHDWAGRAIREGGLVIDLSSMRQVSVEGHVASVAGGATAEDVASVVDRHHLAAVTGTVGAVGMIGLSLGGGYGPFCGRFGLAADNVVSAEVVLADGRLVHADHDHNPDLLWALQGGGGNFGIVTSIDVELHPLPEVLSGSFTFPYGEVDRVLTGYGELISRAPDDLTAVFSIVPSGDGSPIIMVSPTWSGPVDDGHLIMEEFAALADPLTVDVSVMSPLSKLRQLDGMFPDGELYAIGTCNIESLTPAVVSAIVEAYETRRSSGSYLNIHHFHGRATDRALRESAFGRRDEHLMVEMIETGESLSDWTVGATAMLTPYASPGGYPNLLSPDDAERSAAAYGPNASQLLDIKDRFDPEDVFHATALPRRHDLVEH